MIWFFAGVLFGIFFVVFAVSLAFALALRDHLEELRDMLSDDDGEWWKKGPRPN